MLHGWEFRAVGAVHYLRATEHETITYLLPPAQGVYSLPTMNWTELVSVMVIPSKRPLVNRFVML